MALSNDPSFITDDPKITWWNSSNIQKQDKEISIITKVGYLNNIILTHFCNIFTVLTDF